MRTLFFILALTVLVGCGGRGSAPATAPEKATNIPLQTVINVTDTLASDTLRLGRMHSGEVVAMGIGVYNNTHTPIVITRTETTCGCTDVDYPSQPIPVGDTARVEVRFDSQGFYGWQFKRVRLYTSADVSPLTIYVEAEVE
jgi:hypothetical protein